MDSAHENPCALVYGCLILYEMADKGVDFVIADKYQNGSLSYDPKESVHDALHTFIGIGMFITAIRIILYLWRIQLYRTYDHSEDKTHDALNLWMSLAKVLLEAFPQSTIAKFYFSNCVTTDSMKTWVQAFDVFSIFPFIMFVCYLVYYYYEHGEEPSRVTMIIMAITFIFSVMGFIFASLSIKGFNEPCPPRP